ncbi:DNA-directed RNA polymerase subunit delta [Selenomonas sp. FOBRC6]|uniref:DNA-directed RNA polymerase subunit delta n=1 Tax=Selenomonas sp. FOBRC6 TaxID=936572 RepID=UPI000277EB87|nr:DNA-directed RNA polymerase subunit delta [Selenomonas sp. FOBRC6]EJO22558.1 DNA-directed RNA polymerase, delta subunit [Selenomonas sp. FOBRC6]
MDFEHMSEVDAAYHILAKKGTPVHYKELITEVIEATHKPVQSLAMAISEIYTMMNMDSRFHYEGESKWGLTEWVPPEVKRSSSRASSAAAKTAITKETARKKKLESIQN